ncbi:hypothetical protein [Nocardia aurea]|uniref:hypothetical protein n=1 Tax=Nocardia aurea TaxID=2144174 RepID=UPI0033AD35ED
MSDPSDREDLAAFARDHGWTVESNDQFDTYTRAGARVDVHFSIHGHACGGDLNGVPTHSGEDMPDWARYVLRQPLESQEFYTDEPDWRHVRRVDEGHASYIDPELEQGWPDLWKLRWHAAVVSSEIGIWITVSENPKRPGWFGMGYRAGDTSTGTSQSYTFDRLWDRIVGMATGFEIAQRLGKEVRTDV